MQHAVTDNLFQGCFENGSDRMFQLLTSVFGAVGGFRRAPRKKECLLLVFSASKGVLAVRVSKR